MVESPAPPVHMSGIDMDRQILQAGISALSKYRSIYQYWCICNKKLQYRNAELGLMLFRNSLFHSVETVKCPTKYVSCSQLKRIKTLRDPYPNCLFMLCVG